jgi:hypothetical protein
MVNLSNYTMKKELYHVEAESWNALGLVSYCKLGGKKELEWARTSSMFFDAVLYSWWNNSLQDSFH